MSALAVKRSCIRAPSDPGRIALWQFGGVGDMLLATPVIEALHKAYPDAELHIWCSDPPFAEFLIRLPGVAAIHPFRVYEFDSRTLLRGTRRQALRDLLAEMKDFAPDMVVNLHVPAMLDWWAVEWWVVSRLAGCFSLGFNPRFIDNGSVYDCALNAGERDGIHYTALYRRLLEDAGLACGQQTLFPVSDSERAKAADLLNEASSKTRRRVCMHIGARRLKVEGKMWPLERFAELADRLLADGVTPVLTGVQSEWEMAEALCGIAPGCVNLAGKTSLGEMAALIALCNLFVGHDSGPFHVAAAVGTPCIAICGRPDAEPEYLQYGREDVRVLIADDPQGIRVNDVLVEMKRLLSDD